MKKLLLGALLFSAVGSDAQTVKKVILHDYTGAKCQFCTDGTLKLEALLAANPTTFIPVQIHAPSYTPSTSKLKTVEGDAIDAFAQPAGYPAGSVDMLKYAPSGSTGIAMGRGYWDAAFQAQKAKTATVSISINNRVRKSATTFEADLVVEFSQVPTGPVSVNAFILEDSIKATKGTEYAQSNYASGPYSGATPLTWEDHKYVHNNVLRQVLLTTWGKNIVDPSGTIQTGKKYTEKITFTLAAGTSPTGWVEKNIRIVAFVANNTALDKQVLNGEMLGVAKTFFPAGVNQVANNVEIFSSYPNPARVGDVVNVEFNISTSQLVTMNVYNMAGQKVATPYISNDVVGGHTIQWKTGLDNLAPGTYLIEVATAEGRQTQKVVLQ